MVTETPIKPNHGLDKVPSFIIKDATTYRAEKMAAIPIHGITFRTVLINSVPTPATVKKFTLMFSKGLMFSSTSATDFSHSMALK